MEQPFNTAFQHSIKMVFRESHCDSVCVEVMETQKTQFSHLWPEREGTQMVLEEKVKEPERAVPYQLHELRGTAP